MTRVVLGKFLEMIGMFVVAGGFLLGLQGVIHLHYELLALAAGVGLFVLGYILEGRKRV